LLFALGTPVAFAALVVSFLLGLCVRAIAVRLTARSLGLADRKEGIMPRLREDVDPFGAVGAALGGMGWGKMISVDEIPRWRGRGRAAAVFAAGPLSCIILGEALIAVYAVLYPDNFLSVIGPADVLLGVSLPTGETILLSIAVGLLSFGLLAIVPIPPLDGFGILYNALRRPGPSMQWMRLWFEEKNIGVLILLICSLFPFGYPFLLRIVNALGLVFVRLWG
jgi:Zn-dependent protease